MCIFKQISLTNRFYVYSLFLCSFQSPSLALVLQPMMYQTSKQITKFIISGVSAVLVDLAVYYALSIVLETNLAKAAGFVAGTFVTYNLNKFWTWRQPDQNNKRLVKFLGLYAVTLVVNVLVNDWALTQIDDITMHASFQGASIGHLEWLVIKVDKILAFVIATAVSTVVSFLGQKLWVFRNQEITSMDDSE